jgi:uncharacterized protein (TIGR03086 family)
MNEFAANWNKVAGGFTTAARSVGDGDWELPAPCEGWVARDIVQHLVDWVPPFLAGGSEVDLTISAEVDQDPLAAWTELADGVSNILGDPDLAGSTFAHPQAGTHRLDAAVDMFITGDVLVHTWDLARATGADDTLDADAVARVLPGMAAMGDSMVASGHYQPAVELPPGASPQSELIAATGRDPQWKPTD